MKIFQYAATSHYGGAQEVIPRSRCLESVEYSIQSLLVIISDVAPYYALILTSSYSLVFGVVSTFSRGAEARRRFPR
jgi:hypothetical protein